MIFRRKKDIISPISQPTGTAAQTITFRIKQEARRLDGVIFSLAFTPNATAATGAAWGGYAGIVKEIRVKVQDVLGSRNAVQVSGIGLLSWVRNQIGRVDRFTQQSYASTGFTNAASEATSYVNFFVPMRHPLVEEPFGNYLSLPLSSKFLGDDVIVEVDLWDIGAAGTVFTANPPTYPASAAQLLTLVREVDESYGYVPSELRTDTFAPTSISNAAYEFTSNGYLTSALIQGLSAAALGNAVTRASTLSAGGNCRFEYGREIWQRSNDVLDVALADLSAESYPSATAGVIASSTLFARNWQNELMFDFFADLPGNSAFSIASVPNLYTQALGGDKGRFVFNDFVASRSAMITQHRFLPANKNDIQALAAKL